MSLFSIRNDYPPYVRAFLGDKQHGNWYIENMEVCRTPVLPKFLKLINALTFGVLKKQIEKRNYDDLYHLYILADIVDPNSDKKLRVIFEKNQVINIGPYKNQHKKFTCIPIKFRTNNHITMFEFLDNGYKFQEETIGSNFFRYDVKTNNCQVFLMALVLGNNIECVSCGSIENLTNFIKQDLENLVIEPLLKLSKKVTDAAAVIDRIVYGEGI